MGLHRHLRKKPELSGHFNEPADEHDFAWEYEQIKMAGLEWSRRPTPKRRQDACG